MKNKCRLYSYFKSKNILKIVVLNNSELMESLLNCASVSVTKNSTAFQGTVGHKCVDSRI